MLAGGVTLCLLGVVGGGAAGASTVPGESSSVDPDWNAVVEAANEEGRVVLYYVTGPAPAAIESAFEATYPEIDLEFLQAPSGEMSARLDQERTQGLDGADVAVHTEALWFVARDEADELLPINGPATERWRGTDFDAGDSMIVSILPWVLAWNTTVVEGPLTSYEDLLRPEFAGEIATLDLQSTSMGVFYNYLEETFGADFWQGLADQDPRFFASTGVLAQAVGSGEVGVAAFMTAGGIAPVIEQGAPVEFALPDPDTLGVSLYMGAMAGASRPNAARVLMDFILSDEGQQATNSGGVAVAPLGAEGALETEVLLWDPADYPQEWMAALAERWNEVFLD